MKAVSGKAWPYPGARWWKCDFHTHTPASVDYGKGPDQARLRRIEPREWLLGFMRAGIDCVAVTDHNSGEWIDRLKGALAELRKERPVGYRPMYLFPGVEVSTGGIHILALMDGQRTSADVAALLGSVGYRGEWGSSEAEATTGPTGVAESIVQAGGIPILAHVDAPKGAWSLSGNALAPLLDVDGLFAAEVRDPGNSHPELYGQRRLGWAEIVGSDAHHPEGEPGARFPGSHFTWVKMAKPTLDGVRLALLDGGGFSVRRHDDLRPLDPFGTPQHFVESVEIADARYMGLGTRARLRFSPWLNSLVGGRGTGKSTVVHALRLASQRDDELEALSETSDPRVTFERFNRVPKSRADEGGLRAKTRIIWTYMRDGVRSRVHWPHEDGRTRIEEDHGDGVWVEAPVATLSHRRFPIRIFSQGHIAALAGERQQALLALIDEAADLDDLKRRLTAARTRFLESRARIRRFDERLRGRDELVGDHADVERKLRRFQDARHRAVLTSFQNRRREQGEAARQFEAARSTIEEIKALAARTQAEDVPDGLFADDSAESAHAAGIINRLAKAITRAAAELATIAQRLEGMVDASETDWAQSPWQAARREAESRYEDFVVNLRAEGVSDPSEYGRLMQDRRRLADDIAELDSLKETRDRESEKSDFLLQRMTEARRALSDARESFLLTTLANNRFVRIESRPYGEDPRVIEHSLREVLEVTDDRFEDDILVMRDDGPAKGIVADLLKDLPNSSENRRAEMEARLDRLKDRLKAACAGADIFGGFFKNYLQRETGKSPELLDRMLTWFPEDGLRVEYSRSGDGTDFRSITQASAGQRAAAMLAFLLAYGEQPLVLDQPEDDLDNHLIYDLVVRQIRENKLRRQIIVVTHNPNIVVNGDAEMLYVLEYQHGQCRVAQEGSLQERAVREEVCNVMEGGREALDSRYRRLRSKALDV